MPPIADTIALVIGAYGPGVLNGFPRNGGWRFDVLSALMGAILAWIIAGLLYARREALKVMVDRIKARIQRLGGRLQASQEERYLHALQEALRHLLLFAPKDPQAVFIPPTFIAPAPLPKMPHPDGELPSPQRIKFANLLKGHARLLISGQQTSGRTTALAMTVWVIATPDTDEDESSQKVFSHFPVWIDLRNWAPEADNTDKDAERSPVERLAELAVQFFPQAMPKFITENLKKQPSLILVDNWDMVAQENRRKAVQFIEETAAQLPDSVWIIAAGPSAHGPLVEKQFIPLQIVPPSPEDIFTDLYAGWAKLLGKQEENAEIPDDIYYTLQWAALTKAPLLELTLRTVLYLRAGQAPERPIDVMETLLEGMVPMPKRGGNDDEVADQVRDLTMTALGYLARNARIEGEILSKHRREGYINNTLLPPEDERPPKLESLLNRTLQRARILRRDDEIWTFGHYVWEDFFCAWALARDPEGLSILEMQLYDPAWTFLFECYVGLGDATPLVQDIVQRVQNIKDKRDILRVARWAMIVPEDTAEAEAWRKVVMKGLAQTFTTPAVPDALRLQVGRALALLAGETSRPFFLKALRHSNIDVRATALRGLGWVGSEQEMEILEAALLGKDVEIQHNAALALAELGTSEALRLLYQGLSQSDERVMLTISEALAETPEGWEMLKEAAESADLLVRRSAAHGLARVKQSWAADILVRMVREDPEWLVQSAANAALQAHTAEDRDTTTVAPPPDVTQLAWLKAWATKHKWSVKTEAEALKILARAAEDDAPTTRMMVAYTLAYIGRWDHMTVLNELLTDMDPAVRNAAAQALKRVEDRYALGRRER